MSAAHRTGRTPVAGALDASAELLALLALDPALARREPRRALFLDTETTGLAGGTGTVAFLVGLAWWDGAALVLEQLLVRALGEEAPMLERVRERIEAASMLVTFNGKSFDMPLLRTRFVMTRLVPPTEPPHLDLLHVARRVHGKRVKQGCRLVALERDILGFERVDDVASGDVSACYLHFLRTGDTRSLLGVIEHNAWDVVAMAALLGLYGEPLHQGLAAEDLVGVARTLRRAGAMDRAIAAADAAVDLGKTADSLRARAEIAKARGDRARALADFESLAATVDDASVRLELAKVYEHWVKAPARALEWVERGTGESPERLRHRKERLARKAARRPCTSTASTMVLEGIELNAEQDGRFDERHPLRAARPFPTRTDMDPSEQFRREVEQNIRGQHEDKDVQALSRIWVREVSRYKYSYNFTWMGRPVIQVPQDLFALQEIIWRTRPEVIVETGVAHGGSLIFHASMLALLGPGGRVIGVDIDLREHNRKAIEEHPMAGRIELIQGSSIDPAIVERVRAAVGASEQVLVILDSNHTHEHVLAELRAYAPLVRVGSYVVVYDTLIEDLPAEFSRDRPWGPGNNPKTAVRAFLATTSRFKVDERIDAQLLISVGPQGYLRCTKDPSDTEP
jgi:cephalosporin hydroxylase/uncharacterized protein YprB with RNaseH-like and TPR domain